MQAPHIDPKLGVDPDGIAAQFMLAEQAPIQNVWQRLQEQAKREGVSNVALDFSQNGIVGLAGRYLLPGLGKPVYWAVRDNRVHFSVRFDRLSPHDRMLLVNQVMVMVAHRSQKDDLKSVAFAVTESGHFYVAFNTQERPTMDWTKECAEDNLARVVKQLSAKNEKLAHMYILGGLTDERGNMHISDHLIGMCMRCVEVVSGLMAPHSKVTVVPANDGRAGIGLRPTVNMADVLPYEAWEVPYAQLKGPSLITFSDHIKEVQAEAFQKICSGQIDRKTLLAPYAGQLDAATLLDSAASAGHENQLLVANQTPEAANALMVAKLSQTLEGAPVPPKQVAIAVIEITEGDRKRYEVGMEIKGGHNAEISPVSEAVVKAHLRIPKFKNDPHISHVYFTGYNADGSPYECSAEQWDRLLKRTGKAQDEQCQVEFISLNDGDLTKAERQLKSISELAPTKFPGSKQHGFREGGQGGGQRCC